MFRILEPIELQGWREQPIDMPLVERQYCPCDGMQLRTVAAVTGDVGPWPASVRVGCCPACGYTGYIDRPSAEWFQEFYASEWDPQQLKAVENTIANARAGEISGEKHPIVQLAERIPVNPEARVFEMGTGYGWALKCMKQLGYKHLSGVESCQHRARIAREGFGFDVRHESLETHQGGPYDVILSHHVLEHCYDPTAIMRKLASLQPEGGYLILAVPNNAGEPTMGVLMFLPHLHSFTVKGLRWLLQDAGYTVLDDMGTSVSDQWVIARKTQDTSEQKFHPVRHWEDCFWAGEHKLRKAAARVLNPCLAWWCKHGDPVNYCLPEIWESDTYEPLRGEPNWRKDREPRVLRVEPIRERRTDAPIEIQWEWPLRLFVK